MTSQETGAHLPVQNEESDSARLHPTVQPLTDSEFVRAFENCQIPASQFRHRDHLRLAWILLRQYSLTTVLDRVSDGLRRFADHHGVDGLFNQTITWTYIMAINQHMGQCEASRTSFEQLCSLHPELEEPVAQFMERLYSAQTWSSDVAKETFLLPDRFSP